MIGIGRHGRTQSMAAQIALHLAQNPGAIVQVVASDQEHARELVSNFREVMETSGIRVVTPKDDLKGLSPWANYLRNRKGGPHA